MTVKQFATLVVIAAAAVVAHPLNLGHARRGDVSLSDWHSHHLESYWTFRNRYRSFNCASQKGTDFYETCCYPLAANEHADSLPPTCKAVDGTCDVLAPTSTAPALSDPTPGTEDNSNNGNSQSEDDPATDDENDGDLPWCDEVGDGYDDGDENDGDYQDQNQNQDQNQQTQDPNQDAHSHYPPSPSPTSNPDPGDHEVVSGGWATWYEQEGLAGACGEFHSDDELIAAMDYRRYGNIDRVSSLCGKRVHITNTRNGRTVEVVIRDVCPSCKNENSIDLSLAAFAVLDDMEVGMLPIDWYFMN